MSGGGMVSNLPPQPQPGMVTQSVTVQMTTGGEKKVTRQDFSTRQFKAGVNSFSNFEARERAKEILLIPVNERTHSDINHLVDLTEGIAFFEKQRVNVRRELCGCMMYEHHEVGEVLFEQGDPGSTFYVILSGSVHVTTKNSTSGERLRADHLYAGKAFGEIALMKDQPRAAGIECAEFCEFLTIQKDDYQRILATTQKVEQNEIVSFLASVPLFSHWTRAQLQALAPIFTRRSYTRNKVIIRQDQPATGVYFILHGECKVVKEIEFSSVRYRKDIIKQHAERQAAGAGMLRSTIRANARKEGLRGDALASRRPSLAPIPPLVSPLPGRNAAVGHVPENGRGRSGSRSGARSRSSSSSRLTPGDAASPPQQTPTLPAISSVQRRSSKQLIRRQSSQSLAEEVDYRTLPGIKKLLEVSVIGPREYFGELAIVSRKPRAASIVSITTVELLFLTRNDFERRVLTNRETLKLVKEFIASYPTDRQIKAKFAEQVRWLDYKAKLVKDIVSKKEETKKKKTHAR